MSVGEKFEGKQEVRKYLEDFFVCYETKTNVKSIHEIDKYNAKLKVDFNGKFGHETGGLDFTTGEDGLITRVGAYMD